MVPACRPIRFGVIRSGRKQGNGTTENTEERSAATPFLRPSVVIRSGLGTHRENSPASLAQLLVRHLRWQLQVYANERFKALSTARTEAKLMLVSTPEPQRVLPSWNFSLM